MSSLQHFTEEVISYPVRVADVHTTATFDVCTTSSVKIVDAQFAYRVKGVDAQMASAGVWVVECVFSVWVCTTNWSAGLYAYAICWSTRVYAFSERLERQKNKSKYFLPVLSFSALRIFYFHNIAFYERRQQVVQIPMLYCVLDSHNRPYSVHILRSTMSSLYIAVCCESSLRSVFKILSLTINNFMHCP